MKNIFILVLLITLTYSVGRWLSWQGEENANSNQITNYSNCDPTKKICEIGSKNTSYRLQINGVPSALVPFLVIIDTQELQPESVELSFDMDGMDMGFNKHNLVNNDRNWQARIILPVCSLGRNDWLLNVKMKFKNTAETTVFKFSQAEN